MEYIINFLLLISIYIFIFYKKWINRSHKEFILKTIMYFYIVMVLFVTLMPFPLPFSGTNPQFIESANFTPFRDLRANYEGACKEIILNIIMMIPFGFLYPSIKKAKLLRAVLFTFIFSLTIESSQLLTVWWVSPHARSFDVTDLITNTFGGFLGYIFFKVFFKRLVKRHL